MTVVNLRGTHGAGKSTVIQRILREFPRKELIGEDGKLWGYLVTLPSREPLAIVGPYRTACGGCDALQPYSRIWPLVDYAAKQAWHVLFEGALVSCSYGSIGTSSEGYGERFIFATLDTPLETCIQRVNQRRAAKGKGPLEDTKNIEGKFKSVLSSHKKAEELGRRVFTVRHSKPTLDVLSLFGIKLAKEPSD